MMNKFHIILITLCFFFGCREKVRQEVYLIPDHFIGNIIIVYNQPHGKPDSIVNNIAFYKIPESGVLYVKGKQHVRVLESMKYYYYNYKGERNRICDWMYKNSNNCKTIVYNHRTEWYGATSDPEQRIFAVIPIGTRDSIPPAFDATKFHFNKIN